jgi:hypothetical protein
MYFDEKFEKFKKDLMDEDLSEIKKLLFSSLVFFDEVEANIERSVLDFPLSEKDKEPKDFRDFYSKFTNDCIFYILDNVLTLED